jgi:hypothetical protein
VDVVEIEWAFADNQAVVLLPLTTLQYVLWLGAVGLVVGSLVGQKRTGRPLAWAAVVRDVVIVIPALAAVFFVWAAISAVVVLVAIGVGALVVLAASFARPDVRRWRWPQDSFSIALVALLLGSFVLIDGLLRSAVAPFALALALIGLALFAALVVVSRKGGAQLVAGLATPALVAVILAGPWLLSPAGDGLIDYSIRTNLPSPNGGRTASALDGVGVLHYGWVDIVVRRDLVAGLITSERNVDHITSEQDYIPVRLHWVDEATLAVNGKVLEVPAGRP